MSVGAEAVATAVVVAGDEETRVLLRGLLRLHHVRVEGEADGSTQGIGLVRTHRPSLLVADITLAEGSAVGLLSEARELLPHLRTILVAPASRPPTATDLARVVDTVLLRPFRIRQFAEAIRPNSAAGPV